jgi:PilX N-terminal
MYMRMTNEKGIALVLSLFLLSAMSVIAASLMFLSQTETYSSMNYRLMSQARYGAESGIQKAANHLLYTYAAPITGGADPIANYNTTVSPVTCTNGCPNLGRPVVLSANAAIPSNYPNAAVQAAFLWAVQGTLPAGNTTVAFAPYATLLSMQQIEEYGSGGVLKTIQTWQITSTGTITAGKTAQVEVSATLETPKFPAQMYGAFGTAGGCGTLNFHGNNTQTDSYNSGELVGGNPDISNSGGNVGTNGNLTEGGGADIYGTLSSPRVGVGACSDGNVNALSSSGGATVNGHNPPQAGDILQLPQAVSLPTPWVPAGVPTTAYNGNGGALHDGDSVGNVTVNAGSTLTLGAPGVTSVININSITINGNANLVILGTVILNVVGSGETTPIDFTGGSVSNASFDPSTFRVMYAGTGAVKLNGGAHTTAMVYSPNAAVSFNGGGDFYGSVVGATIDDTGGARIHYDRRLSSEFFVVGNAMMSSFTWKKY